jgi:ankyrin repeat protein
MPAKGSKKKEKGSKKGSKKGKGKKVPENTKVVRDMHVCCTQGNAVELQKFLEIPLGPERKWDFSQPGTAECLPLACENGAVTCARLLLDAGCEVDVVSGKALHKAVTNGHEDVVHLLTERGANLNIRSIFEEKTALMYAAHEGRMALATFLLRNGARVDEKSHEENCGVHNGWSALHFAADEGHMKMVGALLRTYHDNMQARRLLIDAHKHSRVHKHTHTHTLTHTHTHTYIHTHTHTHTHTRTRARAHRWNS